MLEATPTVGSVEKSFTDRQALARASFAFNRKTAIFRELFPDLVSGAVGGEDESAVSSSSDHDGNEGGGLVTTTTVILAVVALAMALGGMAASQQLQ